MVRAWLSLISATCFRIGMVVVAIVVAFDVPVAQAQDYPSRVVRVVNPYVAGSTTDRLARALSVGMASRLGREFVVENRAGAGGATGTLSVVRSDADGYTLLFAPALVLSVHPQARNDAGYKTDSLVPICQTFVNAMALAVRPQSPIKNVADLVAAAKAKPGAMNYGHQGPLTIPHLAMEELLIAAKVDIKDIPYRGEPLVVTDLIGGRIDVASLVLGTITDRNTIRPLGIFSETRHSSFADVPTVKEQGYDVSPASFGGLFAPIGTPAPVVARLAKACAAAAKDGMYANAARHAAQPSDYYADATTLAERLKRDIDAKARVFARIKK
jgi:tripartite-type tricarboxylate transporter receptor subunit TctC